MRDDAKSGFDPYRSFHPCRGRGAVTSPVSRFAGRVTDASGAGDEAPDEVPEPDSATQLGIDHARRVISYNDSPDIPFDRSINPYRGCEHGCVYCYARPSHSYLDLSPGLDFETRLRYKPNAPEQLKRELSADRYTPAPIAIGVNTDAWQPVERELELTRRIIGVLAQCGHPATLVTKSVLIERDIDWLAEMASRGLVHASISVTTLDTELNRRLEPRAAGPKRRLRVIERLRTAGVPVSVLLAPVIPGMTDSEMEAILAAAADHGASAAGWIPLRLPNEVEGLFTDWLRQHYPDRCEHVLSLVRQLHGGNANSGFGYRLNGSGAIADMLAQRFRVARRKTGLATGLPELDCSQFERPEQPDGQLRLFAL